MGIRDFLDRLRMRKQQVREFENSQRIEERYYEKKKSANERELEKFIEKARQEEIKRQLDEFRKAERQDIEFGHQILNTKNMFKHEKPTIMRTPNMFSMRSNLNTRGGLFFK